ncbi:tRNA (adenosine(37)-N6)-threonylcarbamoyltransferase complex dimerization subunit type 1 TsaB [Roseimaritima sediminicola]|uniref:tRNA (adenosine(37)-N6)-threonylcarbamoyltransferase complex dimerization subunit type 1 TsaB n=1 Tax=Roseimaritima sediminicola TaxID=2662066 RepID=UPI0012983562|nr:tRNA (adenosine(37)-N6)-threonylcarbamoyltransferase complex dimerization subunit type 1 TsaB [Roseimaritima sediminicola]
MTPWHLAIETSGRHGSLALLRGDRLEQEIELTAEQRTAASLFPAMERLLQPVRTGGSTLGLVSVSIGPGSFTGLRIGATVAKTLAYATKCSLVAVDTLELIARQAWDAAPAIQQVLVGMKAYRGQVFARHCDRRRPEEARSVVWPADQWQQQVARLPAGCGLAGDAAGLPDLEISSEIILVDAQAWRPTAATLGRLAAARTPVDPLKLVPNYLRPSAAEEKRLAT